MLVHLIRHANAESRKSWTEPDSARPLSPKGISQAEVIARFDVGDATIHTSPAVRCHSTIEPMATRLGVKVHIDSRLAEGADPQAVVTWICEGEHETDLVLCAHGDVLPQVLRLMALRGMTLDGPGTVGKGSIWTCKVEGGHPAHASYRPPPAV
ncbi:MAG: histidine phosphatase family protein [Actinomycetia bacterium]|nr:histidine phosphatase family protein [Actinomycetes bacterium]MCP4960725.1 histidine phosphatase family protein [Actinomycetes bacterium]